ncbi:FHA domain-containing protein [Microbacterium rhizomatis]|nr:FHA domain-containing protein [Microbacterium rhizomatis]
MTTQEQTRPAGVDPLVATSPARAGQRVAALAIDAAIPLAAAATGTAALATRHTAIAWMLMLVAAAAICVTLRALARTGSTLGHRAVATRTVRRSTGAAAAASLVTSFLRGDLGTFDIRRGRDPFAPALMPFVFPEGVPAAPRGLHRGGVPVIALDSGQRLTVSSALVLGRSPSAPADAPAEVYQWPDLSRSLSRSHARIEWDGRLVWVTDLGSTNGTFLQVEAVAQELVPFQRTAIPPEATLELGDRMVTVSTRKSRRQGRTGCSPCLTILRGGSRCCRDW